MAKRSLLYSLVLIFLLAAASNAAASIHGRISDQRWRIKQGVASGQLTHREAQILKGNLNGIRHQYRSMKADGMLSVREQRRLNQMLDRNSRMIYRKKHNPVRRLY